MSPTLTITENSIPQALARLKAITGKSWPEILSQNGRLVAVNLAFQTQPYGRDNSAKQKGINAVRRDIGKVYATGSSIFSEIRQNSLEQAKGFYKEFKKGNYEKSRDILQRSPAKNRNTPIGPFDKGAAHKASKNSIGRVSRRRAALIVENSDELKDYVKTIVKRVGFAKGGWAVCAAALGGVSPLPKWISSQPSDGAVIEKYNSNSPSVTLINNVHYISVCLREDQVKEALRIQAEKMIEHVRIVVEKSSRSSGFKN